MQAYDVKLKNLSGHCSKKAGMGSRIGRKSTRNDCELNIVETTHGLVANAHI